MRVGGPADVHELKDLMITKVAVGPMDNNAYLLRCRATDEQLLIDAANDAHSLLGTVGDGGLASVVTTHRHGDHWQALADVVAATGARTYAGRHDAEGIPVPTDVPVDDGDTIRVGQVELTARHLVGHTPGSIVLVYDDPHGHPPVFTGDCLFPGGVGNTHDDPKAFASLIHDVETKVFDVLPDGRGSTRARQGHLDRRGTAASPGVARTRLVTAARPVRLRCTGRRFPDSRRRSAARASQVRACPAPASACDPLHTEHVPLHTAPRDHTVGALRDVGVMPERLALVDVGDVDLHHRQPVAGVERIQDRDGGVRSRRRG